MIIKVKEKELYIKVEDEYGRVIYENKCCNVAHYECIKFLLIMLKNGKEIDNTFLKKLED